MKGRNQYGGSSSYYVGTTICIHNEDIVSLHSEGLFQLHCNHLTPKNLGRWESLFDKIGFVVDKVCCRRKHLSMSALVDGLDARKDADCRCRPSLLRTKFIEIELETGKSFYLFKTYRPELMIFFFYVQST